MLLLVAQSKLRPLVKNIIIQLLQSGFYNRTIGETLDINHRTVPIVLKRAAERFSIDNSKWKVTKNDRSFGQVTISDGQNIIDDILYVCLHLRLMRRQDRPFKKRTVKGRLFTQSVYCLLQPFCQKELTKSIKVGTHLCPLTVQVTLINARI